MIQDILPHTYHVTYQNRKPTPGDYLLYFRGDALLASLEDDVLQFPLWEDRHADVQYLFSVDDRAYFMSPDSPEPDAGYSYLAPTAFRTAQPMWQSFAAITAVQIHRWYGKHRFCGSCGGKMEPSGKERAMVCPRCGQTVYPTLSPSVIVAILNGDRLLLTQYAAAHSAYRRYALVAGYAEVGETLEDTVRREVMEEVGLRVKNLRYYKSQPWSFSDALLAGFVCDVDGDDTIRLDENELGFAGWFLPEEIPENPLKISLTNEMIQLFREGKLRSTAGLDR